MRLRKVPECQQIYVPIVTVRLDYALPTIDRVSAIHLGEEVPIEVIRIGRRDHVVRKTDELSERTTTS